MQNEEREVLGYRPLIFKIGNPEATKILINNKIINISKISKKDANYSYFEIRQSFKLNTNNKITRRKSNQAFEILRVRFI